MVYYLDGDLINLFKNTLTEIGLSLYTIQKEGHSSTIILALSQVLIGHAPTIVANLGFPLVKMVIYLEILKQ